MKRFPVIGTLLLVPAVALFVAVGCRTDPAPKTGGGDKKTDGGGDKAAAKEIAAPGDAKVVGVVKFKGTFEEVVDPDMKAHKESAQCMAGGKPHTLKQDWIVGKDKGLANVLVTIEAPEGSKYKVDAKFRDTFKDKKAILDQPYCAYTPHLIAVYAEVQPFVVKNSAKFAHNTNIKPGPKNEAIAKNKIIQPGESWEPMFPKYESKPINISCELHGFMQAKLITVDHPYFAVTKDDGSFEIDGVPSGQELVVKFWHEVGKTDSKKMTFKKGDNKLDPVEIGK